MGGDGCFVDHEERGHARSQGGRVGRLQLLVELGHHLFGDPATFCGPVLEALAPVFPVWLVNERQ
jgi:hypothetical protein